MAAIRGTPTIRTGATCCSYTSTSTAAPGAAAAPAIRPAGARSRRASSTTGRGRIITRHHVLSSEAEGTEKRINRRNGETEDGVWLGEKTILRSSVSPVNPFPPSPPFLLLPRIEIAYRSTRDEVDIEIGERDPHETEPRKQHVALVQPCRKRPRTIVCRRCPTIAAETVDAPSNQMPPRMAPERVERQQRGVDHHDHGADADAEAAFTEEGCNPLPPQTDDEKQRAVQGVAMEILKHEQRPLAAIREGHAAHGA